MRNHVLILSGNERDRQFLLEMAARLGLSPCGADPSTARLLFGRADCIPPLLRLKEMARSYPSVPLVVFVPPSSITVLGLLGQPDCLLVSEEEDEQSLRQELSRLLRGRTKPGVCAERALPYLTERERQVVALLASGQDNRQIARHLGIRPSTVSAHKKNLFLKTGVHSSSQLVAWALVRELPLP